jgi:hypothetical protein
MDVSFGAANHHEISMFDPRISNDMRAEPEELRS